MDVFIQLVEDIDGSLFINTGDIMKICKLCTKELPKESFSKTSSYCKPCKKVYNSQREARRKKLKKYTHNWG